MRKTYSTKILRFICSIVLLFILFLNISCPDYHTSYHDTVDMEIAQLLPKEKAYNYIHSKTFLKTSSSLYFTEGQIKWGLSAYGYEDHNIAIYNKIEKVMGAGKPRFLCYEIFLFRPGYRAFRLTFDDLQTAQNLYTAFISLGCKPSTDRKYYKVAGNSYFVGHIH